MLTFYPTNDNKPLFVTIFHKKEAVSKCTAPQKLDTKLLGCFYEVQLRTKAYYR